MPSSYPSTLHSFGAPGSTTLLDDTSHRHSTVHTSLGDVLEAVQAKLGYSSATSGGSVAPSTSPGDLLHVADTLGRTAWGPKGVVCLADQIATATAASVSFANIPQTYRHLMLLARARHDSTQLGITSLALQFNGNTATSYAYQALVAAGASVSAFQGLGSTSIPVGGTLGGGTPSGRYAANDFMILDYASTAAQKTARGFVAGIEGDGTTAGSTAKAFVVGGNWNSTAPITSISMISGIGAFAAGSRFSLFGVPTT